MRTVSAAKQAILNGGNRAQHVKVEIKDAGGSWRDMATYPGFDSVEEVSWTESLDDGVASAEFSFIKELDGLSLAPLMDSGPNKGFNPGAATSPLIAINREIRISSATVPGDVTPVSGDFEVFFHGRIDSYDASGETVSVAARDLAGQIQDTWIEVERVYSAGFVSGSTVGIRTWEPATTYALNEYIMPSETRKNISGSARFYKVTTAGASGNTEPSWTTSGTVSDGTAVYTYEGTLTPTAGATVQSVIQEILDDNGLSSITLSTPVSPGWNITVYVQARMSVWEAIRALALQIGWDLRFLWDGGTSTFKLSLVDPDRAKTTSSYTFDAGDYESIDTLSVDKQNIRNVVRVVYENAAALDPSGNPMRDVYETSDATSISKYGRLFVEFAEEAVNNIDSAAEAQVFADAALADLKDPTVTHDVTLAWGFPWAELNDLYTFSANGRHYSADQKLALYGITHTAREGQLVTQLACRGKPSIGRAAWASNFIIPNGGIVKENHALTMVSSQAGTSFAATPTPGGVRIKVTNNPLGQPVYFENELHISPTTGFTPDSSTLIDRSPASEIELSKLNPGQTYYAKLVPWYRNASKIVRGYPSTEVSFVAGRTRASHLASEVDYSLQPLNARLDNRFDDAGRKDELPDHWTLKYGTLGTEVVSKYDGTGQAGNSRSGTYYVRLTTSNSRGGIESNLAIVERGLRYCIRVLAKNVSGTGNWAIKANWYDFDLTDMGDATIWNQSVTTEVGTWFERAEYVTAPNNARYVKLEVSTPASSTMAVDIDTVRIEEVPEIARYYHDPDGGAQAIATATDTIIDFSDAFDSQTNSNVTTGAAWKYTAPKRGYYLLQTAVTIVYGNNDSGTAYIEVWKNGSAHRRIWRQSGHVLREETQYMASCMLYLNRGDYISVSIYQATGHTRSLEAGTQTYVEIMQVG